jgi:hypothetical protein
MPVNVRVRSSLVMIREISNHPNRHLCHQGSHNDDDRGRKISRLTSHFPLVFKNRAEGGLDEHFTPPSPITVQGREAATATT